MIKINVIKEKDIYKKIIFLGHALYDDYGKDIVCAGVSSILITTVNAIIKYNDKALSFKEKDGIILDIHVEDNIVKILLDNMIDLLKELESKYPQNISVREDDKDE